MKAYVYVYMKFIKIMQVITLSLEFIRNSNFMSPTNN